MASQPWLSRAAAGPMLRPATAANYLGISTAGYYALAAQGTLPKPLKIGSRATGVPQSWLDAVVADRAAEALANAS